MWFTYKLLKINTVKKRRCGVVLTKVSDHNCWTERTEGFSVPQEQKLLQLNTYVYCLGQRWGTDEGRQQDRPYYTCTVPVKLDLLSFFSQTLRRINYGKVKNRTIPWMKTFHLFRLAACILLFKASLWFPEIVQRNNNNTLGIPVAFCKYVVA